MVHKLYISRAKLDVEEKENKGWLFSTSVCAFPGLVNKKMSRFLIMGEKRVSDAWELQTSEEASLFSL